MKHLRKKVSYLQGLMAGLDLEKDSKEGRILAEIVEVLDDMAEAIADLREDYEELEEYLENIDEDLYDLEDEVYEDEEDDEDEEDEEDEEEIEEDEEEDGEEGDYIEVECPKCHEVVCFDADILDDEDVVEVTCPNCETVVFVNESDEVPQDQEAGEAKEKKTPVTSNKDTDDI